MSTERPVGPSPASSGGSAARRGVLVAAAVVLVALAGWFLLGRPGSHAPPEESSRQTSQDTVALGADARTLAGVRVEPARTAMRTETLEASGVVALDETRTARIGSMVEGVVIATHHDVGDRVRAGTQLASLHSHLVHDSWAAFRKAVAERRRATNDLEFAKRAEERAKRLYADKAVSAQDVQRAEADRLAAEEQLDIMGTEVRRAEEDLEHLGITNAEDPTGESGEEIPSRSPIDGVILERHVTAGTAVTPGTPMFVVSDLSSVWVVAEVDESRLSQVAPRRTVSVRVAAYPDATFAGTVTLVGDVVNPKTRRVTVRCQLPNPDGRLKPEMFTTVLLGAGDPREVVVVPAAAVHALDGKTVVFVQEAGGAFRPREITAGPERDGLVEVRAGLRGGEQVVTTGSFLVKSELLKASAPGD
jgi:cobalt-zinc-cadmium efflux system membrane fusion protein